MEKVKKDSKKSYLTSVIHWGVVLVFLLSFWILEETYNFRAPKKAAMCVNIKGYRGFPKISGPISLYQALMKKVWLGWESLEVEGYYNLKGVVLVPPGTSSSFSENDYSARVFYVVGESGAILLEKAYSDPKEEILELKQTIAGPKEIL